MTSSTDHPNVSKETPVSGLGSLSAVKDIYYQKTNGGGKWMDEVPDDIVESEMAKYAIVVWNKKSEDAPQGFEPHRIVVHSPQLVKVLSRCILKDYPGIKITPRLPSMEFKTPFKPLVHRWVELLKLRAGKYIDDEINEEAKKHTELLYDTLKAKCGHLITALEDCVYHRVITFDHLWVVFQPGAMILSNHVGSMGAFEFEESYYGRAATERVLYIKCKSVDWSGKYFGRNAHTVHIHQFEGTRIISKLNAFPLRFYQAKDVAKAYLIGRGKKFQSLTGYHCKAYSGPAMCWDKYRGSFQVIQVTGRIIVDADTFDRCNPFSRYPTRTSVETLNANDNFMIFAYKKNQGIVDETGNGVAGETSGQDSESTWTTLTPYHLALCSAMVHGYSLKLKKWLSFYIDLVSDVVWGINALDSLVLPDKQKELILSLSESQRENRDAFDDVIRGKGKGFIILLSGPPGVGKTLTVEALAETLRVPLHTVNSGDLGSSSNEVQSNLSRILELAAWWNAILLIDECDVFLESRSTHDLERNKIVSIFLNALEYYEGILFLTSNRIDNIDQAFQSRIHVSMVYPDHTTKSRREIWRNLLRAMSLPYEFSEEDLENLSTIDVNGRQIKNILKTAQLLASRKATPLSRQHVETVLEIEKKG